MQILAEVKCLILSIFLSLIVFLLFIKNHKDKDPTKDKACGHLGHCALRELRYFEIGESFCFDSLHGLYAGVFVSISSLPTEMLNDLLSEEDCKFFWRLNEDFSNEESRARILERHCT